MGAAFWVKRALIALIMSFSVIFIAQYLKSSNVIYAFTQASIWGVFASGVYLLVLWSKLRKNPSCAIKQQEEK